MICTIKLLNLNFSSATGVEIELGWGAEPRFIKVGRQKSCGLRDFRLGRFAGKTFTSCAGFDEFQTFFRKETHEAAPGAA
jgi:hypothetical protein